MLSSLLYPPSRPDTERLRAAVRGKTVLLTGASFGIGEALAGKLATAGARPLLVARSADKLAEVQTRLTAAGAQAEYFAADLRDAAQCEAVVRWTEENGGADILVLNAGHSIRRGLWQSLDRFHDVERCMSLNFYAPARLTLALLPELARRGGSIVAVSAVNARFPAAPGWAAYQASKTALTQWFGSIAPEAAARGVSVGVALLPLVRTRMIEPTAAYRRAPAMTPQAAADVLAGLIVSRRSRCRFQTASALAGGKGRGKITDSNQNGFPCHLLFLFGKINGDAAPV